MHLNFPIRLNFIFNFNAKLLEIRFIDNANDCNLFNAIDYSTLFILFHVADFVCHTFSCRHHERLRVRTRHSFGLATKIRKPHRFGLDQSVSFFLLYNEPRIARLFFDFTLCRMLNCYFFLFS